MSEVEERCLLDDVTVTGDDFALALTIETLATLVEVFLVEFATHVVEAHLVGCYAARLTAHHGVKDAVAWLGELVQ